MNNTPIIIKGCPRDKWESVQAIQHQPFVYIMGNGSHCAGSEESDIDALLDRLSSSRLDVDRFGPDFCNENPCRGIDNPDWTYDADCPRYIDGPRLYECDGVCRFFGNFIEYSHGFHIDTNHAPTIRAIKDAIAANLARQQRKSA